MRKYQGASPIPDRAFWKSVRDVRRNLLDAAGCAYHIGFGEHPFLTLATFSIWQDLPSMQQFAYRHTAHHRTSEAARSEAWLSESLFVRFAIKRIEGDLAPHPGLQKLVKAGLIQTGSPGT
jgi:spheroidene monooxygenase